MRVSERMFFIPPIIGGTRDAECVPPQAGLRDQKRKDLQRDSGQGNSYTHKNMLLYKMLLPGSACCYLFSFVLKVPRFSAGSKENKSNNKLCVLCAFAVKFILSKTLLGSPFKPPFLGVVVD